MVIHGLRAVALTLGIFLATGCDALINVPIATLAIMNSGDSFVGRNSKYWTDIAYMGQYVLIRDIWVVRIKYAREGYRLVASTAAGDGATRLTKGIVLRTHTHATQ